MDLNRNSYYFCRLNKPNATLEKIRRYCFPQHCPHLGIKKRKGVQVYERNESGNHFLREMLESEEVFRVANSAGRRHQRAY
jgi:hypothetical protein